LSEKHFTEKKHDMTIMMSSSHLTSSGACLNDSPWAFFHKLSIGTVPLSGFVFEIFIPQDATTINRLLRDDVINDVIRPGSTIHEDHIHISYRGTLLKFLSISDKNCRRRCILNYVDHGQTDRRNHITTRRLTIKVSNAEHWRTNSYSLLYR